MPKIYIVAGTPGIGKSTSGKYFVPSTVKILNHDSLLLYFKNKSAVDYEELSNLKANEFILEQLNQNQDFGVELNLGFDNHYDLLRFVKKKFYQYKIEVILFHTDNIQLCIDRAILREKFGGHAVKIHIIEQMYKNMIPLLQNNASLIHNIQLINVEFDSLKIVYPINNNLPSTYLELVNWVKVLSPETLKLESSINNRM
ncbi:hypothetical protein VB796_13690 [Arcicella sp. LKC2W]|uniref:hypothetical protein n=1 Tax=Arcicella sp. LKC2W TaxID=2984198 RepID=UPI002B20DC05|nr:hypothetical protein [Arcicella sp. LKC2W]MEA5460103.1 hypothetical protein [Arcicella sp. LKC2W]